MHVLTFWRVTPVYVKPSFLRSCYFIFTWVSVWRIDSFSVSNTNGPSSQDVCQEEIAEVKASKANGANIQIYETAVS